MPDVIAGFRLSPQQQRLWSWQQESAVFQARCLFEIEGPLDLHIFRESLRKVIERHEILRTLFHWQPDLNLPLQVIGAPSLPEITLEDLSEQSEPAQQQRIEELFSDQHAALFDFEKGPLVRLTILRLTAHRHVVRCTLPSLCADSWTLKNMVHELGYCYDAAVGGVTDLPEATQYVQFSEWQNELVEEADESGKSYWRRRCGTSSPIFTLPYERRIKSQTEFKTGCVPLVIAGDVISGFLRTAGAEGPRLREFLLAGWHTLLWRLSGESSTTIGVEVDGRKFEELHGAFGLFTKYLPLPQEFEPDAPFSGVVKAVSEALRDGSAWQEYFVWEDYYAETGDNAGLRSFPVQFSFEEWPAAFKVGELQLRFRQSGSCVEEYKLKLGCLRRDDCIVAEFHFDLRAFAPEQVQLIAGCFETLIRAAIADPEQGVGALEIFSENDFRLLTASTNSRAHADLPQATIQQLFEERAGRRPDALAAWQGRHSLSYAELNGRANQLAHFLRRRGVGPNVLVALCVTRSLEMLVGLLGVLKAGGAYLPLDPDHPQTRLAFQIAEGPCPILLTEEKLLSRMSDFTGETVCLDRDQHRLEDESSENPDPVNSLSDLAYVIFTSGSTGVPKGVEITHRSLANYSSFICRLLGPDQTNRLSGFHFATVSTLSADLGNTCIFPSLISGGCLHILDYEVVTDGQKFAEYLIEHPIDVLKIVPSHLSALLPSLKRGTVFPRSHLILGGETFSFDLLRRIAELSGSCQVFNHYGPTETTVGSLVHHVNQHQETYEWSRTVPIGRPIANTEIFILDDRRRPVPPGVAGELYLGGAGLARGYLNRPDETNACFIKNPFSSDADARLYRTGDLARYLPDGNVEFCGRADQQVKVNGFRIELGEIENGLRQHPDLREAIVQVGEDELGHIHLIAYCVPQGESAPSPGELRSALMEILPGYMIPRRFITLKSLPLTPNGKVDRGALPPPHTIPAGGRREIVSPRTPAEKELAGIWKDVLGVGDVGVYDNFFELGGDSVLTIQIIARARQAGLAITPKQVFDYPTIAALAEFAATNLALAIDQGPVSGPAPLLPIQQWFFERDLPEPQHYNQALLLEVKPTLTASAIEKAVRHLLLHHDALRLRFVFDASGWRQFNASPDEAGDLSFATVDLARTPAPSQAAAIETEVARL
ncbi:MAG TPA: amino acid adenylation domain-containing protein, partial [Pyrinomonadaceae bacterium]|nr:amino acid adenylation domain-containing protein [Pyrinomonadaceae bacterium]